jgi:hypothetical protein
MAKEQGNKGFIERSAGFLEKFHHVLGAIALVGAAVFESATLAVVGVWEIAHGALWGFVKNRSAKKPQPAPA